MLALSGRRLGDTFAFRNGLRAKNRAWLAPMTNQQSHADGSLSDDELHWLEMRADGGFGVIETCAAHVAKDGQGWSGELGVFEDALAPGLERLARAMSSREVVGIVQTFHGGARADRALTGEAPWSATAFEDGMRAATEEDIARVIAEFGAAAARAHRAGFQGVELHGAHGYLLCQFLSALQNTRTDGWGTTLEGRARLVRECLRASRAAVPASFAVGVRLSPEDWGNAKGLDLDEIVQVAKWLCDDGADFVHLSLWDAAKNTKKRPAEHAVPLFRAALPADVPIVVAGKVWTHADAQALLDKGADGVAVGRAAIANPAWAAQATDPAWEPRRPPLTIAELEARGLSRAFAGYMRQWRGFVSD